MNRADLAHSRYSKVAITLHWLIALIILGNLVGGLVHDRFLDDPDPAMKAIGITIIQLHKAFGLTVIGLTLLRILWRLMHKVPALPSHMTSLEVALAKTSHFSFYVLMLALPLSGWAMVSASMRRFPIDFFGLGQIPYLPLEQAKPLSHFFGSAHELLGYTAIALIAVHILAAFKHHVFDRDDVLTRMLPWGKA